MQTDGPDKLYTIAEGYVPKTVLKNKNRAKTWFYGYNEKYDLVVISKTGEIGDVMNINGVHIALPPAPKDLPDGKNRWVREELPKELSRIQSIFQWNDMPKGFKANWVDYIEAEFDRREDGHKERRKSCPVPGPDNDAERPGLFPQGRKKSPRTDE